MLVRRLNPILNTLKNIGLPSGETTQDWCIPPSFRRLQGKIQLFPNCDHDFFRTRITHSIEVAQVAKSIAIRLNATNSFFQNKEQGYSIDTNLIETAALAHDLGHPPFGAYRRNCIK